MPFTLPNLPFEKNALEGWTSAETLAFHHGKHHAGYVTKLNSAIEGTGAANKDILEIINETRETNPSIFNLAAQHFNHSFFWNCLTAQSNNKSAKLDKMIDKDFGGFDAFKEQFSTIALKHFGSGWIWLVQNLNGQLTIIDTHDANTPAGTQAKPILTLDIWEHAYYIDHRNDRAKFIDGFWAHLNWEYANNQIN